MVDEGIASLAEQMGVKSQSSGTPVAKKAMVDFDIQSASEWPGVESDRVLLDPVLCRKLWRQFTSDSAFIVQQAQATQVETSRLNTPCPPKEYFSQASCNSTFSWHHSV